MAKTYAGMLLVDGVPGVTTAVSYLYKGYVITSTGAKQTRSSGQKGGATYSVKKDGVPMPQLVPVIAPTLKRIKATIDGQGA